MEAHRPSSIETADPDTVTTITVAIVGTIIVVLAVVLVQGLYERANRAEFQKKVVAEVPQEFRDLKAAQLTRLHQSGWVDKKNGIAAVPIDRAMELMVADPNPAAPLAAPPAAAAAPEEKRK